MPAAKYDFLIEQGATFSRQITWRDSLGEPIDLTGYAARMQIRRSITAPEPMVNLTTENGGIFLDGESGNVNILISASQTQAMNSNGVYDLELVNGDVVTRLIEGVVELSKGVTRE
jgi:hypothetical protein